MWTRFHDMNTGGWKKLEWAVIYIEASEKQAESVFFSKLGISPSKVSSVGDGADYFIEEYEYLRDATDYDREKWGFDLVRVDKIPNGPDIITKFPESEVLWGFQQCREVLFIYSTDIAFDERTRKVPKQGWVWVDGTEDSDE